MRMSSIRSRMRVMEVDIRYWECVESSPGEMDGFVWVADMEEDVFYTDFSAWTY